MIHGDSLINTDAFEMVFRKTDSDILTGMEPRKEHPVEHIQNNVQGLILLQ